MDADLVLTLFCLAAGGCFSLVALLGKTRDEADKEFTPVGKKAVALLSLTLVLAAWKEVRASSAAHAAAEALSASQQRAARAEAKQATVTEQLETARGEITRTSLIVRHTMLALLDLQVATRYQNFKSFRLGMMWYWLHPALNTLGDAERQFRWQLAARPTHAPSHYNLGIVLAAAGRPAEAADQFRAVLDGAIGPKRRGMAKGWLGLLRDLRLPTQADPLWRLDQYPEEPRVGDDPRSDAPVGSVPAT